MGLFDEKLEPEPMVRKRKASAVPAADVLEAEALYASLFEEKWGCRAALKPYGKNRRLLREDIENYGKDEVLRLLAEFFRTTDGRAVRTNYTIVDFHYAAQWLRLNGRRPHDQRTAENIDAATRATRRRQ